MNQNRAIQVDPALASMPVRVAIEYCQERISECAIAIGVAQGRYAPERGRIQIARALPGGLTRINGKLH